MEVLYYLDNPKEVLEKILTTGLEENGTLIIGIDQFNKFHLWKDYEDILNLVNLQVVSRPGEQIIDNNMSFNHTKLINVDASSSFIRACCSFSICFSKKAAPAVSSSSSSSGPRVILG